MNRPSSQEQDSSEGPPSKRSTSRRWPLSDIAGTIQKSAGASDLQYLDPSPSFFRMPPLPQSFRPAFQASGPAPL